MKGNVQRVNMKIWSRLARARTTARTTKDDEDKAVAASSTRSTRVDGVQMQARDAAKRPTSACLAI